MMAELPGGHVVRAATLEDAGPLADLFNACTIDDVGVAWTDEGDMRADLTTPGFDIENDAALVLDERGELVAGLLLYPDGAPVASVLALGLVRPDRMGRGLGTVITALGEERSRNKISLAAPTGRFTVRGARFVQNEAAAEFFRNLGYTAVRTWWRMTVGLSRDHRTTALPDGILLTPFDPARDGRAVYDALQEAFEDHWGEGLGEYQAWSSPLDRGDPASRIVLVARDGDQIAGALIGRVGTPADPEAGSVVELGVRRPWRGRGLGLALLRMAFDAFQRRGLSRAILIVDSESPTGATRLYERAGMTVELAWDYWEKELRPGP